MKPAIANQLAALVPYLSFGDLFDHTGGGFSVVLDGIDRLGAADQHIAQFNHLVEVPVFTDLIAVHPTQTGIDDRVADLSHQRWRSDNAAPFRFSGIIFIQIKRIHAIVHVAVIPDQIPGNLYSRPPDSQVHTDQLFRFIDALVGQSR